MTFKQAMIVPTMVTLGCGALLLAQNLSLIDVSYAAPAPEGAASPSAKPANANAAAAALPAAQESLTSANNPEFGTGSAVTGTLHAVTDTELARRAVEASGREDPFMALLPPEPGAIAPPPSRFTPPALSLPTRLPGMPMPTLPGLQGAPGGAVLPTLPNAGRPAAPALPNAPRPGAGGAKPNAGAKPAGPAAAAPKPTPIEDLPFSGEKAPAVGEPQWIVRGIMSTGSDRVTLLEGKDEDLHAHVGDVLSDGSRVEAISNRGVTFIRNGRRFVKTIGGNN